MFGMAIHCHFANRWDFTTLLWGRNCHLANGILFQSIRILSFQHISNHFQPEARTHVSMFSSFPFALIFWSVNIIYSSEHQKEENSQRCQDGSCDVCRWCWSAPKECKVKVNPRDWMYLENLESLWDTKNKYVVRLLFLLWEYLAKMSTSHSEYSQPET